MRSISRIVTTVILVFIVVAAGGAAWGAVPLMGSTITTAQNPGDQYEPAVAWDNEHKRWLVVWEQDISGVRAIVGRVINNGGAPLTDSFFISDDPAKDATLPDVVYDPGHDRYLVVWVHQFSATDTDILGRFVTWDGLQPAVPFPVENPTNLQFAPAVEYNPPPVDEYFVVWENLVDFDPETIRAKRLYPDSGSQVGPSFEVVGDTTFHRRKPAVAWNADAGRYLVTYERYEGTAQEDVYAASVSYSGTVFSPDLGIAGYAPDENQIDVAACDGSWMVVWKNGQDPDGQIYARPVAGDLALGTSTNVSMPYVAARWPAVDCIPHGVGYFLVWEQGFTGGLYGVAGAFVAGDGTLLDKFNVLGTGQAETRNFTRPAVSIGDYLNRAYVVWETDRADLAHVDLAGRWVEMVLFADDFETGNTSRWSVTMP